MMRPGTRLRALAARVCSVRTMGRLIDPVIADLQAEYDAALRTGSDWKRRRVLLLGYIAFGKVIAVCGVLGTRQAWHNWDLDDQQNLRRVLWSSCAVTLAFAFLIEMPGLLRMPETLVASPDARPSLLVAYLIPAALATSVPIGLFAGTALGLRGRHLSRRLVSAVLLVAVVTSAGEFLNVASVVPASNQWYREEFLQGSIPKGEFELTLIEMRRAAEELRRWDAAHPQVGNRQNRDRARRLSLAYHQRYALATAPLTFALFAVVLAARRRLGRTAAAVVVCGATACIILVSMLGAFLTVVEVVPPAIGAWLSQIVLVSASLLLVAYSPQGKIVTQTRA
jgi:lipopolysaccharide export LptBFGC system permease protein LptF